MTGVQTCALPIYLSRASLGELWSAMLDGTEQQAFLASLIFRPFASSTLWPEVVARIPSIAGYVAMLGGIYAFAVIVGRRPCP